VGPKTHFWALRHEKEKRIYYVGLRIILPIQIQLLNIENPKKSKIASPYCTYCTAKQTFYKKFS
jgi:hypothetical protein